MIPKLNSQDRAAVAGMAAVVLFVCAISFTASYFERDPTDSSTDTGGEQNSPWWSYAAVWETFGTWAIAIYAIRQYSESSGSSEKSLRAYIGVEAELTKFSLTEPIEIAVIIKNVGQTPARKVATHAGVGVSNLPLRQTNIPTPRDEDEGQTSLGAIYPGLSQHIPGVADAALSVRDVEGLTREPPIYAIYVYGECAYIDVLSRNRLTSYCLFIAPADVRDMIAQIRRGEQPAIDGATFVLSPIANDFT